MTPKQEMELWAGLARTTDALLDGWDDLRPAEALVVDVYNPAPDLQRRALAWSHEFTTGELPELLRFAAGLTQAELTAWEDDQPDIATRALSDRRFFFGDRVIHWAVPWLDAVAESGVEDAIEVRDALLHLGDHHRPEPDLAGPEGLSAPGEDRFGERAPAPLSSLLSGGVILERTARQWGSTRPALREGAVPAEASGWFEMLADRWEGLRKAHPGSAALWRDLSVRARGSAVSRPVVKHA